MDQDGTYRQQLSAFLLAHPWFRPILETVRSLDLPDWLVGAGVIRSLVWDHLHGYATPTQLADVDMVFFDPTDLRPEYDAEVQAQLRAMLPDVPWEATNQAAVHLWYEQTFGFAVPPLTSSADGVATWPETATSIAVRLQPDDTLEIVAPCGLHDLFGLILRRNPRRVTRDLSPAGPEQTDCDQMAARADPRSVKTNYPEFRPKHPARVAVQMDGETLCRIK